MGRRAGLPLRPDLSLERGLLRGGSLYVAGLDEVGRGAWAGPIVAAAVLLPLRLHNLSERLNGVRDSKQMSPGRRQRWDQRIRELACGVGVGEASREEVDGAGVVVATRLAMGRAVQRLPLPPDFLLIDCLRLPEIEIPQHSIVHGDARCLSIAAASIVAKVARDRLMVELEAVHPGYGFAAHKGYGTRGHRAALERHGASPIHRMSFAPLAGLSRR